MLLSIHKISALSIAQIRLSNHFESAINISLDTEAIELYYFQSWQYTISGKIIVVEACFVPGFGSTIALLNNNFQIPIPIYKPQEYQLIVKVYYDTFDFENLQDSQSGFFSTPVSNEIVLNNNSLFSINQHEVFYPNPTNGKLFFSLTVSEVQIFDKTARLLAVFKANTNVIDMSNLSNGVYFITYRNESTYKTIRILLKK